MFWLIQTPQEVENLLAAQYASAQMVNKYVNLKSQNKITAEENASLLNEQTEGLQIEKKLGTALTKAIESGVGFFRGIQKPAGDLGKDLAEIFHAVFDWSIPDLYPKVALGCRPLKGSEAEDFLKQANLNSLPQVFYQGPARMCAVAVTPRRNCPICRSPPKRGTTCIWPARKR